MARQVKYPCAWSASWPLYSQLPSAPWLVQLTLVSDSLGVTRRHAQCVRQLSMRDSQERDTATLPAAVTTALIGSQCGSLLTLSISAADVGLAGAHIIALAALTALTRLEVRAA